jgi:response regulator RpfG family c-di-GMP phosphodiesterase
VGNGFTTVGPITIGVGGQSGDLQDGWPAVLYVDDEPLSLKLLPRLCEGHFRVFTASTAREGLDLLEAMKGTIGVVLADRCMPQPNGAWLLARARELHPAVIRILASDGCCPWDEETLVRDGTAQGLLRMPWDLETLILTLRLELERFAAAAPNGPSTHP